MPNFIQDVLTNKKRKSFKLGSEFFYIWVGQVHVIILQVAMLLALFHRGKFICILVFRSVKFLFVSTVWTIPLIEEYWWWPCFRYQTLSCWCCTIHSSKKILRLQVKPCGNSSMFGLLLLPQWLVQPLRWYSDHRVGTITFGQYLYILIRVKWSLTKTFIHSPIYEGRRKMTHILTFLSNIKAKPWYDIGIFLYNLD